MSNTKPLTFGSLFAGIGGIDLGFERAGLECKWQVEIDNYANRVLEKHWPDVHRERDIRECGRHNLKRVDILAGGFPCQDISVAGNGAGLAGERSGLFFEIIRLARELRPRAIVLENSPALLNRGLGRVLGELAQVGFDAEWHCIPAAAVGASHIRDRIFVLAYSEHGGLSKRWGASDATKACDGSRVPSDDGQGRRIKTDSLASNTDLPRLSEQRGTVTVREKQFAVERGGWWKTEPKVGRVADGFPGRVGQIRGLGNAVVPEVAQLIANRVKQVLSSQRAQD